MKQQIGVIFGGKSVEHEISIISAIQAMENIDRNLYDVIPIYISKDNRFYCDKSFLNMETFKNDLNQVLKKEYEIYLEKGDNTVLVKLSHPKMFQKDLIAYIDVFFEIVHGTNVEDGSLSGYLNMFDIPIVGPSVLSGAIGQDKAIMKDILKANNIKQTKYIWASDNQAYEDINKMIKTHIGYPVIIKPANLGSSVGIEVVDDQNMLATKLDLCFNYDNKVVIEQYLTDFIEVNISLRGNYDDIKYSLIEQVNTNDAFLNYENKYLENAKGKNSGMASLARIIPAPIDANLEAKIKELSKQTFLALNVEGIIRIDFMIYQNEVYLNEVNNIPGSLAFYLWENDNYTYQDLLTDLIEDSINYYFKKQQKIHSINTNVLDIKGSKNGCK